MYNYFRKDGKQTHLRMPVQSVASDNSTRIRTPLTPVRNRTF